MAAIADGLRTAADGVKKFLDPHHDRSDGYVYSSAKIVTGLIVLGAILYPLTKGWGTLIALALAIFIMLGRRLLQRQAAKDFSDLEEAQRQFKRTKNGEYLDFIEARCNQMLTDNKVLTKEAKAALNEFLAFAKRGRKKK